MNDEEFATYEELVKKEVGKINENLQEIYQYGKQLKPIDEIINSNTFLLEMINASLTLIIDNDILSKDKVPYSSLLSQVGKVATTHKELVSNTCILIDIIKNNEMSLDSFDELSLFESAAIASSTRFVMKRMALALCD